MITRGLTEMRRLGAAIGARPETLMGLAGLGDLVLTCTGDLAPAAASVSRSAAACHCRRQSPKSARSSKVQKRSTRSCSRNELHGLDLPIAHGVQRVLHEDITPAEGLRELLARERKPEISELIG